MLGVEPDGRDFLGHGLLLGFQHQPGLLAVALGVGALPAVDMLGEQLALHFGVVGVPLAGRLVEDRPPQGPGHLADPLAQLGDADALLQDARQGAVLGVGRQGGQQLTMAQGEAASVQGLKDGRDAMQQGEATVELRCAPAESAPRRVPVAVAQGQQVPRLLRFLARGQIVPVGVLDHGHLHGLCPFGKAA